MRATAPSSIDASDRIEVIVGDIGDLAWASRRGLRPPGRRDDASPTTWPRSTTWPCRRHCAAVNVDGTGNVLELLRALREARAPQLRLTAYVAGMRTGTVYEHELVIGQDFKNHYESTKYQAEVWVREYLDKVPTTIYRPAIVVGDSKTGETQKFDGPYYILRTFAAHGQRAARRSSAAPRRRSTSCRSTSSSTRSRRCERPGRRGRDAAPGRPRPGHGGGAVPLARAEYAEREPKLRVPPKLVENVAADGRRRARRSTARRPSRSST